MAHVLPLHDPTRPVRVVVSCWGLTAVLRAGGTSTNQGALVPVGAAQVDITPDYPGSDWTGYGNRKTGVGGGPSSGSRPGRWRSVATTVTGPPCCSSRWTTAASRAMTEEVARRLKGKTGLRRERFVVSSSHTHCGPALGGVLPDLIFGARSLPEQQEHIDRRYTRELTDAIERVARAALDQRRQGRLAWGRGQAGFAMNRRPYTNDARQGRQDRASTPRGRSTTRSRCSA